MVLKKALFAINAILTLLDMVLKKALFAVNAIIALIANGAFFKTMSRSVNTSFMIKGYG